MKFLEFDKTRDIPYYNDNPKIEKSAWIVLLLTVPVSYLLYGAILLTFSEFIASIVFCFTMLIPLLYFSNWDYSLIFQKPTLNEILLAAAMFAGYMIYSVAVGSVLDIFGLSGTENALLTSVNPEMIVSLIFSMMGEELLKFIPLMLFLRLFFKYSNDRKLSIILSSAIVLIGFALIHYTGENTIISVLLLQGLGTVFELYGYFKTKNLFVPYMSHLFTDAFIMILVLLGYV